MSVRFLLLALALPLAGCDRLAALVPHEMRSGGEHARMDAAAKRVIDGDAGRGRRLVASGQHGCVACHAIPGIRQARGVVGPPLHGLADRSFIAGRLPNEPAFSSPSSRMRRRSCPKRHAAPRLSEAQARDVAAFLYTLRRDDERS